MAVNFFTSSLAIDDLLGAYKALFFECSIS